MFHFSVGQFVTHIYKMTSKASRAICLRHWACSIILDKAQVVIGQLVIYYFPMVERSLMTANVRSNLISESFWKKENGVISALFLIFQDIFSSSLNWGEQTSKWKDIALKSIKID